MTFQRVFGDIPDGVWCHFSGVCGDIAGVVVHVGRFIAKVLLRRILAEEPVQAGDEQAADHGGVVGLRVQDVPNQHDPIPFEKGGDRVVAGLQFSRDDQEATTLHIVGVVFRRADEIAPERGISVGHPVEGVVVGHKFARDDIRPPNPGGLGNLQLASQLHHAPRRPVGVEIRERRATL